MPRTYTPRQRIVRTAQQGTVAAAVVLLLAYVTRLTGLDLDPGEGENMPAEVGAALQLVFTSIAAWWMNRSRVVTEP